MKNIWVLSDNIDIVGMLNEVESQPHWWLFVTNRQRNIPVQRYTQSIQLVSSFCENNTIRQIDSHLYKKTGIWNQFPIITSWLQKTFPAGLSWISIIKLLPEKEVYEHMDYGAYYRVRTRFHLVLKGRYSYTVGDETIIAKAGTLFCFNNSLIHSAHNLENEDRIAVIFDVEHAFFGLGLTIINDG